MPTDWYRPMSLFKSGLTAAIVTAATSLLSMPSEAFAAVDTTPPPLGVFVDQGDAWQAEGEFDLWWINPGGQDSPITKVHYDLCPALPGGPCTLHQQAAMDIDGMTVSLPYPGLFGLRLWLEDEAGNVNPLDKSQFVNLRFDDQPPGLATLRHGSEWLNAQAETVDLTVDLDPWVFVPISEIRGYSLTLDGSSPDGAVEAFATQDHLRYPSSYAVTDLQEGTTEIKARAVSNAGVPSDEVGSTILRVDKSPPSVSAAGLPSPAEWSRVPVSVQLTGSDQHGLSGMSAAPAEEPVEDGGHLAYALDGAAMEKVRGAQGALTVTGDGSHALTYRAIDVAGNTSVEKVAEFRIDRTGPVGSFDYQDPSDPRKLSASVFDAASGVGSGRIEYRREGTAKYEPLPTVKAGAKLTAYLDDLALPEGRYEFRARVWDVAGNSSILGRLSGGGPMVLALPVRLATRTEVVGRAPARTVCVKRARRNRKRCVKRRTITVTGFTIPLGYGKPMTSTGSLTTSHGMPVSGGEVIVEGQLRSGGPFTRLGTARTDRLGAFNFAVPRGGSRTVRYRYEGTRTTKPSSGQLETRVQASVRLKPSKRKLLNGQAVVFRGRLPGRPIPKGGKVVALQAKVGRKWRTFATPRANARGAFRHRYRFTATTGLRRYVFRAVSTREAAYPYERGTSAKVSVVVRGR